MSAFIVTIGGFGGFVSCVVVPGVAFVKKYTAEIAPTNKTPRKIAPITIGNLLVDFGGMDIAMLAALFGNAGVTPAKLSLGIEAVRSP